MLSLPRIPTWCFFLLFAVVFIVAEQASPMEPVSAEEWTADFLIAVREGSSQRRSAYIALAVFSMLLYSQRRAEHRISSGFGYICAAFLSWLFLSAFWSDEPITSLRRFVVLGIVVFWVFVCNTVWERSTTLAFIIFSTFFNLCVCVATEISHGRFAPGDLEYRLGGTLLPNELGLNCMVLVLAALVGTVSIPRWKGLLYALVVIGGTAVVLTKSRTALGGMLLSSAICLHLKTPRRIQVLLIGVACSTLLLGLIIGGPPSIEYVLSRVPRGGEELGSLNGRIPMWDQCLAFVGSRPLLGFGYTTFWTAPRIAEVSSTAGWGVSAAHSAYLEVLLDLGCLGLMLYLSLTVAALRLALSRLLREHSPELLFSISVVVALLVIGVTESELPFRSSAVYFYTLSGLLMPGWGKVATAVGQRKGCGKTPGYAG